MSDITDILKSVLKTKVFISFDFDHDDDLKIMLVGQAKNEDSPFRITDMSVKEELSGDWKEKVRQRIIKVDQVVVIAVVVFQSDQVVQVLLVALR